MSIFLKATFREMSDKVLYESDQMEGGVVLSFRAGDVLTLADGGRFRVANREIIFGRMGGPTEVKFYGVWLD